MGAEWTARAVYFVLGGEVNGGREGRETGTRNGGGERKTRERVLIER